MSIQIRSDRLVLRDFNVDDSGSLFAYRSKSEVAQYQLWEPFTESDARDFINRYKPPKQVIPNEWYGLAITISKTREMIGDLAFKIDVDKTVAEIGFNLNPEFQGKGFATEAVRMLIAYLNEEYQIVQFTAVTDAENLSANRLLNRLGFHRKELIRRSVFAKGRWSDEIHWLKLIND